MSTGRLDFGNVVVGPFRMARPKLAYSNTDGLLVPEAIQLAVDAASTCREFDSLGEGIVDALCIMYAGRPNTKATCGRTTGCTARNTTASAPSSTS